LPTTIISIFIILLAGITQSATGFGFGLVATPLLLFMFEPKSVVILVVILSAIIALMRLIYFRHYINIRRAALIFAGSVFGLPIGVYLLSSLNPSALKLFIAIVIIPFSIVLLSGYTYRLQNDTLGNCIAGFISGLLTASTSFGGPPVVLFLLSQDLDKNHFVGAITAQVLLVGLLTFGTYSFMGMVTIDLLKKIAMFLPVLVLGFYVGTKILHRISASLFKKVSASIILLSALSIIVVTLDLF